MNTKSVVIVDYGMGNIKSVSRAVEFVGASAVLSNDPNEIEKADRVILPGVGAFEDGMLGLTEFQLHDSLANFVATGRPLLGICLGMQMLFDESMENGQHKGLGLIGGSVVKIDHKIDDSRIRKIPHIGWAELQYVESNNNIFHSAPDHAFCYFVHAFMGLPKNKEHLIAKVNYEGTDITAAVQDENVIGFQFHPEKSGEIGLNMLREFLKV